MLEGLCRRPEEQPRLLWIARPQLTVDQVPGHDTEVTKV
jgi:hypothetical protein